MMSPKMREAFKYCPGCGKQIGIVAADLKLVIDLDDFKPIPVPQQVAICAYCGGNLTVVEIRGFDYNDDGTVTDLEVALECKVEKACDHLEMPYVYWLPVTNQVKHWLLRNFNFKWSDKK